MSHCPSTVRAHSIPQFFNLSEALEALEPPKTHKSHANAAHPHPGPSYFSSYVEELYKNLSTIPIQLKTVHKSPPHIYHPPWNGWNAIWAAPHLELDPVHIRPPSPEPDFHNVLFRLQVTAEDLRGVDGPRFIRQGTMLAFKGFDASQVRYVVEWCCRIEYQKAYLKVVGIHKNQIPYPYNDPHFPSFILVVPTHLSRVGFPPSDNAPRSSTIREKLDKLLPRCPFSLRAMGLSFTPFLRLFTSPLSSTYSSTPEYNEQNDSPFEDPLIHL